MLFLSFSVSSNNQKSSDSCSISKHPYLVQSLSGGPTIRWFKLRKSSSRLSFIHVTLFTLSRADESKDKPRSKTFCRPIQISFAFPTCRLTLVSRWLRSQHNLAGSGD
ncbi:hypothetical protein L596_009326 [Steinernema carpocapsae]|uniref:Uncharacterized protein n=1 Tax=Steinernema carpocapsae TaxID=34508 RepID=A0A4U5PGB3_STECR|nr:hypothetical protein L596_009326 [Steinernema carpocapsae]